MMVVSGVTCTVGVPADPAPELNPDLTPSSPATPQHCTAASKRNGNVENLKNVSKTEINILSGPIVLINKYI
jgi:hypothetical protein